MLSRITKRIESETKIFRSVFMNTKDESIRYILISILFF